MRTDQIDMRIHLYLLLSLAIYISNSQILTDEYSNQRDGEFFRMSCGSTELILNRILKTGESVSIRKGREILVAVDEQKDLVYEFEDIDAYSSLFFESAKFKLTDINSDGVNELIVEIEPHESSNYIWIYELDSDCKFTFITNLQVDEYRIERNEIVARTHAVCKNWDDDANFGYVLRKIEFQKLKRLDFYRIQNSTLVNTNSEHSTEIETLIKEYQLVLNQIIEQESKEDPTILNVEKYSYQDVKTRLKEAIEGY